MMLLFLSNYLSAQKVNQCGIIIPPEMPASDFSSVYEAGQYVHVMLDSINWRENFRLREQYGINNAYATIIRNLRYIVYDNNFLENLDSYAGTRWASLSVLAHEMGHHYRNHIVDGTGSTPSKELEADYFSGYVMAKIGASLDEARVAMEKIASPQASSTHPGRADRLNAITNGWNYAKGVIAEKTPQPAPQPQDNPPPPTKDEDWINLSLYGNSDMTVYLSDNGKDYSPVQLNTTQPFVFKFEIYNYGWLKFNPETNARTYKLLHGHDYAVVWSRRSNGWTVISVP
jgi:hypothetical protein